MSTNNNELKHMICSFRKDGSVGITFEDDLPDEPFMGIVQNTINEMADIWFEFVEDAKKAKEKVKPFRIVVRI